jgi:hypothetical protein
MDTALRSLSLLGDQHEGQHRFSFNRWWQNGWHAFPDVLESQAAKLALKLLASVQCLTGKFSKTGEISP